MLSSVSTDVQPLNTKVVLFSEYDDVQHEAKSRLHTRTCIDCFGHVAFKLN